MLKNYNLVYEENIKILPIEKFLKHYKFLNYVSEADKISTLPLKTKTTTTSTTAPTPEPLDIHPHGFPSKKFNTERFMRLSRRPPGYRTSPFLRYRLPAKTKPTEIVKLGKSLKKEGSQVSIRINTYERSLIM